MRVAVAGRDRDKLRTLASALGKDATAVTLDASDVGSIREAVGSAAEKLGRIDFLVNCVGIFEEERLLEATPESFDRVTAVNYRAAMFLGQAVARAQLEQRHERTDATCTCSRCARSSACAIAATRRIAEARAGS